MCLHSRLWYACPCPDGARKPPGPRTHLGGAEADVAQVQDSSQHGPDPGQLLRVQAQQLQGPGQSREVLAILLALEPAGAALWGHSRARGMRPASLRFLLFLKCPSHLVEEVVGFWALQGQLLPFGRVQSCQQLIEDMEAPLSLRLGGKDWLEGCTELPAAAPWVRTGLFT